MTTDEILMALEDIKAEVHSQFGAHHTVRLGQLDNALTTAAMAVQHLVDEEEREVDLANRIMNRESVHGGNEVADPRARAFEETRRVAGKAN